MAFGSKNQSWANNPGLIVLSGIVLLMVAVYLSVATYNKIKESRYIGRPASERDTITLQGEGKVTAVPDIGSITVSIITEDKDATKAMEANTTQFNKLVEAMKTAGVDKKDLTTTGYSVNPRYDWTDSKQVLIGYEVNQSLTIKIRSLDKSGSIIALAGQNGANQVSGLSFTIDEPEALREEARAKALANALEKARVLAKQAGVQLGKIVSFSESSSGGPAPIPYYYDKSVANMRDEAQSLTAPTIEQGSQDIYVYVTVEYEIY